MSGLWSIEYTCGNCGALSSGPLVPRALRLAALGLCSACERAGQCPRAVHPTVVGIDRCDRCAERVRWTTSQLPAPGERLSIPIDEIHQCTHGAASLKYGLRPNHEHQEVPQRDRGVRHRCTQCRVEDVFEPDCPGDVCDAICDRCLELLEPEWADATDAPYE